MARAGWLCAVAPITTVIVCSTWSMRAGLAPACFPLTEGCLSISAACRAVPVIYLFRAVMLPMSAVLVWFWWQNTRALACQIPDRPGLIRAITTLSVIGSSFLALYVVFLGTDGEVYEFLRRVGIYVFFGGAGIAQLLTTFSLRRVVAASAHANTGTPSLVWRAQLIIVLLMLVSGLVNLLLKELLADAPARRMENVIEWNFALVMYSWYALQGMLLAHLNDRRF